MKLAQLYDKVSKHYHELDYFNVISQPKEVALEQLEASQIFQQANINVIDLGVGHGRFLNTLYQKQPNIKCTGLDISPKMLKLAAEKVPLTPIQASIDQASQLLPPLQFDLAIANFVCAYTPLNTVLEQSAHLLKEGAYLSLISSTHESFANIQQQIRDMGQGLNLKKRLTHFFSQRAINNTTVPVNSEQTIKTANQCGFEVIKSQTLITEVKIETADIFMKAAFDSGWAANVLNTQWVPISLAYKIAQYLAHAFMFPIEDQSVVEVLLLKKKNKQLN